MLCTREEMVTGGDILHIIMDTVHKNSQGTFTTLKKIQKYYFFYNGG